LETVCKLQLDDINSWSDKDLEQKLKIVKLNDDIRGYKAFNEALEGRIQKMAGAYHLRELNLLERIRILEEQHAKDQEKQTRT
jgi:hypothetical protein